MCVRFWSQNVSFQSKSQFSQMQRIFLQNCWNKKEKRNRKEPGLDLIWTGYIQLCVLCNSIFFLITRAFSHVIKYSLKFNSCKEINLFNSLSNYFYFSMSWITFQKAILQVKFVYVSLMITLVNIHRSGCVRPKYTKF